MSDMLVCRHHIFIYFFCLISFQPPPTYEEIFYSNPQASPTNDQSLDVHLSINASHSREETRGTAAQSYASVSPMGKEDPRCQDIPTGSANRTAV